MGFGHKCSMVYYVEGVRKCMDGDYCSHNPDEPETCVAYKNANWRAEQKLLEEARKAKGIPPWRKLYP